jgi:multidrug efflux pump subunit AcrA (membrane-fusion protein)
MLARVQFLGTGRSTPSTGGGSEPGDAAQMPMGHRLFVAKAGVRQSGDSTIAWVVDESQRKASAKVISIGAAERGEWIEVASGLRPGDRVILNPAGLGSGPIQVRIIEELVP